MNLSIYSLSIKFRVDQRCFGEEYLALNSLARTFKQSTPTILFIPRFLRNNSVIYYILIFI